MKTDKSFSEIGDLLRFQQPDCPPPPGLEGRILRALNQRKHPAPRPWWPWLLLPPAFAAMVLMMWPRPAALPLEISQTGEPPALDSALESVVFPLTAEADALSRDAQRAGSFLVDCLPSIASQGD